MSPQGSAISVLVADDHAIIRKGLGALLQEEPGFACAGEAGTPQEAIDLAIRLKPDVVLMDIRFGSEADASGIDACREIRSARPATQVVMFTSYGASEAVVKSVLAGATGFLTKNVGPRQVIEAIRAAGRGESLLEPGAARSVVAKLMQLSEPRSRTAALSPREKQVLTLVAQGCTNKDIALRLKIRPITARNHVVHILDKLGLSSRTEAAVEAVRLGLLSASRD